MVTFMAINHHTSEVTRSHQKSPDEPPLSIALRLFPAGTKSMEQNLERSRPPFLSTSSPYLQSAQIMVLVHLEGALGTCQRFFGKGSTEGTLEGSAINKRESSVVQAKTANIPVGEGLLRGTGLY